MRSLTPRQFVILWLPGDAEAPAARCGDAADAEAVYASELAGELARLGHDVEIWTSSADASGGRAAGNTAVAVRRFATRCDYLVPKSRAGGWVRDWAVFAGEHLTVSTGRRPVLVSVGGPADAAACSLVAWFGLTHVHVPRVPGEVDAPVRHLLEGGRRTTGGGGGGTYRAGLPGLDMASGAPPLIDVEPRHAVARRAEAGLASCTLIENDSVL